MWHHRPVCCYSVYGQIFVGFSTVFSILQRRFHEKFFTKIVQLNLSGGAIILFLLILFMDEFLCGFPQNLRLSSTLSPQKLFAKNSTDKFARWWHCSVRCLFSLWMHFCAFFPSKFWSFFNIVCIKIFRSK